MRNIILQKSLIYTSIYCRLYNIFKFISYPFNFIFIYILIFTVYHSKNVFLNSHNIWIEVSLAWQFAQRDIVLFPPLLFGMGWWLYIIHNRTLLRHWLQITARGYLKSERSEDLGGGAKHRSQILACYVQYVSPFS